MADLPALARAYADRGEGAQALEAALRGAASTNHGSGSKAARDAALLALKAAQQRLVPPGDAAAAAVGRAALAAAAGGAAAAPPPPPQLASWRYNLARRLVSCKAFADAHAEATLLFEQLRPQGGASSQRGKSGGAAAAGDAKAMAEAANLGVGTALVLLLCCIEGRLLDDAAAFDGMLAAAGDLPHWLSQLRPEEAAKHREAAHKYLYSAAVGLVERRSWARAADVCGAMLAAAGDDVAAQARALAAAGKLAGHMPDEHAAATAAAAARACTCGAGSALGAAAALELLRQLCSAAQRATSPTACEELRQAVQACASASGQPLLHVAALLLPALALHTGGPSPAMAQAVRAATALVADAVQQLEPAGRPGSLAEQQRQLALLEAAVLPANALRRVLAARMPSSSDKAAGSGELVRALGGAAAADMAASVLELLAGAVGVASRCADSCGGAATALASQGHAAAVGLATAARLRAACAAQQAGGDGSGGLCSSSQAVRWLLGWDLQSFAASSELPPQGCAVEAQELAWLASALFNAGVDLHGEQRFVAAAAAMQAALAVAAAGISDAVEEAAAPRLADFCRKCMALSDAQQQAGDAAGALGTLGHALALLLQLGATQPASWQPLVQAFVRLQADLPAAAEQQPVAAAAAAKRGRGAGAKKAPAAPAAVTASGSQAAGNLLLVSVLQQHAAQLPEGSLAAVVEQELQCWASQPGGVGSAALSRKIQRLLLEVFPAEQQPTEHASVLLALHQAGLQADSGLGSTAPLKRAVAVLSKARGGSAASLAARARCMLAADSARQLARQALLEQQQERQRSHAAASTSAAGSQEQDAAAVGQLVGSSGVDAAGWRRVQEQAAAAMDALQAAGGAATAGGGQAAFEELSWMLGLLGSEEAAARLRPLLPQTSTAAPESVLGSCVFPGAPGTAAELQQAAEAAAEGGRSPAAAPQRAALHQAAAEAFAAAGDLVPALFHASEAHRLLAALVHGEGGSSSSRGSGSSGVSWWRLVAAYLGGLLQLGQLFEAAGLADEAVHALREGQHLATAAGARPLAALCSARLADVLCKQGQAVAAEQAAAAAEQQLAALPSSSSLQLQYCSAAVQLARAQLGGKAAVSACQAAAASCRALAAAAAKAGSEQQQWCDALHAAALLAGAEALLHGDQAAAIEHATAALGAASSGSCSMARQQQAAAALFLGLHAAPQPSGDPHLAVWGLGPDGSGATSAADSPAATSKGRGRKPLAPKQRAARGRSKAAAAQDEPCSSAGAADNPPHVQHLWRALALGRGQLAVHRAAAAALAEACGAQGRLHLAAWLLHSSLGSAMRLQYQLVLFSRRQQLAQRQRRAGVAGGIDDAAAQLQQLEGLAAGLELGLEWRLVAALAGGAEAGPAPAAPGRGRKAAAKPAAAAAGADPAAALAALEQQARQQLQAWQAAMPAGTAACSIAVLPSGGGGSLLISRLSPAGEAPPLLVSLPVAQLSASLSQHPIRALQMDDDAAADVAVSSVQSVLDEMQAVLADSGRSMRELRTDTKEEQREWWRARLALEDRLAALMRHLDSSWLGPWRCLLLGEPSGGGGGGPPGLAAAQHLEQLMEAAGSCVSAQQAGVLRHVAAALAQHAGGMTPGELRQAVHQLVHAAGLACTQEQQHELEALLAAAPGEGAAAAAAPARVRKGRSVKFADEGEEEEEEQQQQEQQQPEPTPAPAASRGSRARKPAASAGRGRRAAAAAADEEVASASCDGSPVASLGSLEGGSVADEAPATAARDGLCQVFDELSLAEPATGAAAAGGTATARSGKHRSRLRMMQAGTPGPATARRAAAATAPRPARQLPLTAAKTAPPPAARPGSGGGSDAIAPVLLVLDGALQALPWESAAGVLRQRCYRMPSLACAAASAQRASTSIDLASTFYALNPSGDLAATQSAFQDWFARMRGWEGTAGRPPSTAELAGALTSRQLFLYCGHGGGEQYIPAAKLRSLERCSAALLMGCSSGRLRVQQHYEPSGAVLAYLLAGCPAAVANLWDVTDKDIDRFSQAVLTAWISGAGSGAGSGGAGADMCAALAPSRGTCKLPHLVGAAPVCYGIPARLFASEA